MWGIRRKPLPWFALIPEVILVIAIAALIADRAVGGSFALRLAFTVLVGAAFVSEVAVRAAVRRRGGSM